MPYAQVAAFIGKLSAIKFIEARALELLIFTATRTQAVREAEWTEFDMEEGVWTIPPKRAKRRGRNRNTPHRVTLSDAAIRILQKLPKEDGNPYVFLSGKKGEPLEENALSELLKDMGYETDIATVHGFRSTFYDWASEETNHAPEARELAMGHVIPSKVEAAYRRGQLLKKRFDLANDWAKYMLPCNC